MLDFNLLFFAGNELLYVKLIWSTFYLVQVMSVTLDKWTDDDINFMIEVGGNSQANATYEAFLPKGYSKPHPDSAQEERQNFIKYFIFFFIWKCPMVQFIPL
jgi:hypothetical protein